MSVHPTAPTPTPPAVRSKLRTRDVVTVALLLGSVLLLVLPLGIVLATVAWATGAGLLWTSTTWDLREKALGTLIWPGGLIAPVLLLTSVGQVCTQTLQVDAGQPGQVLGEPVCTGFALSPWVGLPLSVVLVAAPFVVATLMVNRASTS